ncbi:hypothetical protein D3C73_1152980 [compost metagenome]
MNTSDPIVVLLVLPSLTCNPVPAELVTLISRWALLRSTPPLLLTKPVPVPATLMVLLLANVTPAVLLSPTPSATFMVTSANIRLALSPLVIAVPVPLALMVVLVIEWAPVLAAAIVTPFAVLLALIAPPVRARTALVRTLTPVPASALMVPPLLSTCMVCPLVESTLTPATLLLIVPALRMLTVPVPLCWAEIPVAEVIFPEDLFSKIISPVPPWEAKMPALPA